MIKLRRLMGLPRFPIRVYMLILVLLLVLAYAITGPAYQFFATLRSSLSFFYDPRDFEREERLKEYLKNVERNK